MQIENLEPRRKNFAERIQFGSHQSAANIWKTRMVRSLRESRQGEEKKGLDRTRNNFKQDKKETEKETTKEEIGRKQDGEHQGIQGESRCPSVACPS